MTSSRARGGLTISTRAKNPQDNQSTQAPRATTSGTGAPAVVVVLVTHNPQETFETTPEGAWLLQNAGRFGLVLSYPKGKEAATGYAYEPWHYRYIGAEAARAVLVSGLTLTEYLERR